MPGSLSWTRSFHAWYVPDHAGTFTSSPVLPYRHGRFGIKGLCFDLALARMSASDIAPPAGRTPPSPSFAGTYAPPTRRSRGLGPHLGELLRGLASVSF